MASLITAPFSNLLARQVQLIDFAAQADIFRGTNLTITAKPSPNGGDGVVAIGAIDATGLDLGKVLIDGDLGQIDAGDPDASTPGIKSLTVGSLGRYGTTTQAAGGSLGSVISGSVPTVKILGDVTAANLVVSGGAESIVGRLTIDGSLVGGSELSAGRIETQGAVTSFKIGGSVIGGSGLQAGSILIAGAVKNFVIGGSIVGGTDNATGNVLVLGNVGKFSLTHDLLGGAGSNNSAGYLTVAGDLAKLTVGGSIVAGAGNKTGAVQVGGDLGLASIRGDLRGHTANVDDAGAILANGRIQSLTIGGSVTAEAEIRSGQNIGSVRILGDIHSLGGVRITAVGELAPKPGVNLAIGRVFIGGTAEGLNIIAGISVLNAAANADAQIGRVFIGGDFAGSQIAAGAQPVALYGGDKASAQAGGSAGTLSQIKSVIIKGSVLSNGPELGIVAQKIGAVKIGEGQLKLDPTAKDKIRVGSTGGLVGNYVVREF